MSDDQNEGDGKINIDGYSTHIIEIADVHGESIRADPPPAQKMIILIPGAIRSGQWATQWHVYARQKETDFITLPLKHGILGAIRVLTGIGLLELIHDKRREIQGILDENPEKQISIVCHSYGCYIVLWVLKFGLSEGLHCVCLIGSILKREDIGVFARNSKKVFCHAGTYDMTASLLASVIPWRFDATSVFQFGCAHSNVEEGRHQGGHSMGTSLEHFRTYIIPAVLGHQHFIPREPPHSVQHDWAINAIRLFIVALLTLLIGIWSVQ